MSTRETLHVQPGPNRARAPLPQRRLTSEALMAGAREVIVEHRGAQYRLRVTSNGKLILTK
jgi:hemin uptake protein HemP